MENLLQKCTLFRSDIPMLTCNGTLYCVCIALNTVGDMLCSAIYKLENDHQLIMVVIYISPGLRVEEVTYYVYSTLLQYLHRKRIRITWAQCIENSPIILSRDFRDFNINFVDKKSEPLKKCIFEKCNFTGNNNISQCTINYGTTILLMLFLHSIESQTYASYFGYHVPIMYIIKWSS